MGGQQVICPTCSGKKTIKDPDYNKDGSIHCEPPDDVTCPTCKGVGTVEK